MSLAASAGVLMLPRWGHSQIMAERPDTVRGRVLDSDARPGGAAGIPAVMVSNGRDVVLTNSDGGWALAARTGDIIFVIKPANWRLASSDRHAFYGFAGREAQSFDFKLVRDLEPAAFEALLIADTQPANERELAYLDVLLSRSLAHVNPAFAIHHGDVMADDLSLYARYLEIIGRTPFVWHHCPGNHDMDFNAASSQAMLDEWRRHLGPTNYAFQYAGATFILLNNVEPVPAPERTNGTPRYRGRIGKSQLDFVANVLRHVPPDAFVAVSMHIPLASFDAPDSASDTTADRDELLALLAGYRHSVSFAGHSHTTEHHYLPSAARDGTRPHHHHVLTAASGSWWSGPAARDGIPVSVSRDGTPKGFHLLNVDGTDYTTRFVAFDDRDAQPGRILRIDGGTRLLVDVFDGGPRTRVTCEVIGQSHTTRALARHAVRDPFADELFTRHAALCKPWVKACPSSHVWIGAAPISEGPIIVRITDEYGRSHSLKAPAFHLMPA